MVTTGLECFLASGEYGTAGKRFGLVTNQASVDRSLVHDRFLLKEKFGAALTALFSPQHGFYCEKQDNMIESDHSVDGPTGLPVYSLYGELRKPSREMFANIDILVIDLQDVGTRVYTFLSTMAYCLEAAHQYGRRVVVLDRPNPVGGVKVEGNVLADQCRSFVGLYPLAMRHGMTFGELALCINEEYAIGAELDVVAMKGWKRGMQFRDTGLPWVFPSPNMPTPETALVYPGQVIWEGTNISEGRGTTLPFELFGSPFVDHDEVLAALSNTDLPGCLLRPLLFQPTSGKWANQVCRGFQLHVIDEESFLPYRTSLALLQAMMNLYPEHFQYKQPPYEYEYSRLPMDCILGSQEVRQQLEEGTSVMEMEQNWQRQLDEFKRIRHKYLLYDM
ncbi:MAG: exo-beta-N-acetylmuramidase NamZ domain-containing protein [Desulfopila sp.]